MSEGKRARQLAVFRIFPLPMAIGFVVSLFTGISSFLFSVNPSAVFAVFFCVFWIIFWILFYPEYKLPFFNIFAISVYLWLGHTACLLLGKAIYFTGKILMSLF